jgi:hypothetical protein
MVIAVVDDGGVLKAFSRMDGAALLSVQVAQDKAYTAVGFSMPTHAWHDFIKDDPPLRDGAPPASTRWWSSAAATRSPSTSRSSARSASAAGHYSEDQQVAEAGPPALEADVGGARS